MPISECEVRDPRMRRTRQLLQGALQTLLQARSFDEISVQDITEAATVNRATFYDHYADKYALLEALIAGGFHRLLHERAVRFDGPCASAAMPLIAAVCDFLIQGNADGACKRHHAFEPLIEAAIVSAIRRIVMQGLERDGATPRPAAAMAATSASWAIYGAVKEWFATPDRLSVDEIVPRILQLVGPVLEQATARHAQTAAASHG